MRVLNRSKQELGAEDGQIFSFDEQLSEEMATGIAVVERIHANTGRLIKIRKELGARATATSGGVLEHATLVLKSDKLDEIEDPEEELTKALSLIDSETSTTNSFTDNTAIKAAETGGYLSVLIAAKKAVVEKTEETWKEDHLAGLIGKNVMLWVPSAWHNIGSGSYWRYKAQYSSHGLGFHSGSIGPGHAIAGEFSDLSVDSYGSIILKNGATSYNRHSASDRAPVPPRRENAEAWNRFGWFAATEIFEHHKKDPSRLMPRIKIEEI
jgi:hypothetical protein